MMPGGAGADSGSLRPETKLLGGESAGAPTAGMGEGDVREPRVTLCVRSQAARVAYTLLCSASFIRGTAPTTTGQISRERPVGTATTRNRRSAQLNCYRTY